MEAVRKMNTSDNIININLKEYFWSLLEQWKCILIAGLVFAVLVPAFLAFKNYKEDLDAKASRDSLSAMSYEDLLNTLNEGDREEVLNAAYQAKLIRDQEEYNANSIFAGMNSEKLPVLHYAWTIDDSYDVEQIAAAYVAALGDSETVDVVRQALGDEYKNADDIYVRELIIASSNGAVDLKIVLPEGTDADALNTGIMARLFEIHNQIDGTARKHTVTYIVSEKQDIAYAEIAGELIARNNDLVLLQENYDSLVLSMSDYQRNVLSVLNAKDAGNTDTSTPEFGFSKGNIVIGFAVGIFLYAFIYLVLIVFSSKVQNPELFSETFKTRNLGRVSSYRYKGFSAFVHGKTIYKMHRKESMDDAAVKAVTDAVLSACANKDLHKVGVILAGDMKAYSAQCDKVIKKLKGSSKTDVVKIEGDLNDSALEGLDSAVILAGSGKSKYREIYGIMRLCGYYKKEILGGIYFD